MPLYICRWQNGDFSAVSTSSRAEAIELLDEVGNAEVCELFAIKNFMVHFRLKDEADDVGEMAPIELEGFGEGTEGVLCDRVYPLYFKAAITEGENWPDHEEVPQGKVWCCARNTRPARRCSSTGLGRRSPSMTARQGKPGQHRCLFRCWEPVLTPTQKRLAISNWKPGFRRISTRWSFSVESRLWRYPITPRQP
jgi:hypothetical protein